MEVKRLKEQEDNLITLDKIVQGEIYECVRAPSEAYIGWLLYGVQYDNIYGAWIGHGRAIFAKLTGRHSEFKFRKLNFVLTEVE